MAALSTVVDTSAVLAPSDSHRLVRSFSDRIRERDPNDALSIALIEQERQDAEVERRKDNLEHEWKTLFRPAPLPSNTDEDPRLAKCTQELVKAWEKFLKCMPKDYRFEYKDKPPNLNDVTSAVAKANNAWKEKQSTMAGKVKQRFASVCETMQDYKQVTAMIPSQDKYFSLLTGSFSLIITATISHKKAADAVSDFLEDVCEDIRYWRRQFAIHPDNDFMKSYAAQLYVIIFQILVDIMRWYSSTFARFAASFDEGGLEKLVKSKKEKMQALAQKLENEGKLENEALTKAIYTKVDDLPASLREVLQDFSREIEQNIWARMNPGTSIQHALRDSAESRIWIQQYMNPNLLAFTADGQTSASPVQIEDLASTVTREKLQTWAEPLAKYRQEAIFTRLISQSHELDISIEVLQTIKVTMLQSTSSQSLWILGPAHAVMPSRITLTSANLCMLAQKKKIPTLSYFCGQSDEARNQLRKNDLASLVYSLIWQLAQHTPAEISTAKHSITQKRFEEVALGRSSITKMVSLFEDLLKLRPPLLFCYLDNLQLVERGYATEESSQLDRLVTLLRQPSDSSTKVLKALFTTDGMTPLLRSLQGRQRLDLMDFEDEDRVTGVDTIELTGDYAL